MINTSTDLLELLPQWYRDVLDYQEICEVEKPTFDAAETSMQQVLNNFFPLRMDEGMTEQWEQVLGIVANPQNETLDYRRRRIANRISTKPPFTLSFLYQKLDEMIGEGLWSVTVDYQNYSLYIDRAAQGQTYTQELEWTINHIKPAHIKYISRPYINNMLLLSEQVSYLDDYITWNYRLGGWELGAKPFVTTSAEWNYALGAWPLGAKPFSDKGVEIVAKPTSVTSIQQPLLADVVNTVINAIAAVRLNGSISITDLTKSASADVVTITAYVPEGTTAIILKEELLDTDGNVLTAADVSIPVSGAVTLVYRIYVKEGE